MNLRWMAALGLLVGLMGRADAQTSYRVTDLGVLSSDSNSARGEAINKDGWVAGRAPTAFRWDPAGGMISLGTFGGAASEAHGINDAGWVAGHAFTKSNYRRAFLWRSSSEGLIDLTGKNGSTAWAVNNLGQVVGDASSKGFVWQNGKLTYLPILKTGAAAYALAINDGGLIGGYAYTGLSSDDYRPVYWSGGKIYTLPVQDEASHKGMVYGSNNNGDLVGWNTTPTSAGYQTRATLWRNGRVFDLGTLGGSASYARDINNLGQAVGRSKGADGSLRAFVWSDANGDGLFEMQDLNALVDPASGWLLQEAFSINDNGQITGHGWLNGTSRAFLLTPQ